jgi:hypothetical protein
MTYQSGSISLKNIIASGYLLLASAKSQQQTANSQ